MAYGEKYYHEFGVDGGGTGRVNLLFRDYAGASTRLYAQETPITTVWGRRGADKHTPFLASHSDFGVIRTVGGVLSELAAIDSEEVRLQVLEDGVEAWLGKVETDIFDESTQTNDAPDFMTVEAWDALGQLKDILYTDTSGALPVPYVGRDTFLNIIIKCLQKIGFGFDVYTASHWYPHRPNPYTETTDPLSVLEVDQSIFYGSDGQPLSCYAVLEQVLRRFLLQIYQVGGAWHIYQRELYLQTAFRRWQYNSDGTPVTNDLYDARKPFIEPAIIESGRRTYREAFAEVPVIYTHAPPPNLVEDGDMEVFIGPGETFNDFNWQASADQLTLGVDYAVSGMNTKYSPTYQPRGGSIGRGSDDRGTRDSGGPTITYAKQQVPNRVLWMQSGLDGSYPGHDAGYAALRDFYVNGNGRTYFVEQTGEHEIGVGDVLHISFDAKINEDPDETSEPVPSMAFLLVEVDGTPVLRDGSWGDPLITDLIPITGNADTPVWTGDKFTFSLVTEPSPVAGPAHVKFYAVFEGGSPKERDGIEWDNVDIRVTEPSGDPIEPKTIIGYHDNSLWAARRDTLEVSIGEGPVAGVPNRITPVGSYDSATGWRRGVYGATQPEPENVLLIWSESSLARDTNRTALEGAGFTVTTVDVDTIDETYDFSPYDVVVTCRFYNTAQQKLIAQAALDSGTPCVFNISASFSGLSTDHYVVSLFLATEVQAISEDWESRSERVLDGSHPITEAHADNEVVPMYVNFHHMAGYSQGEPYVGYMINDGDPNPTNPDLVGHPCLIAIEAGSTDLNGGTIDQRVVVWGSVDDHSGAGGYTAAGAAILANNVRWAFGAIGPSAESQQSTEANIDEVTGSVILLSQNRPLEQRFEQYKHLGAQVNQTLDRGTLYLPVYLKKDYRFATDIGEWVRVQENAETVLFKEYVDEGSSFSISSGGGGQAVGGGDVSEFEARVATLEGKFASGVWTPVLEFGGASTGITYSTQWGWYDRAGDVIRFGLRVALSSKGTAVGDANITGLPVVAGSRDYRGLADAVGFSPSAGMFNIMWIIDGSVQFIKLYQEDMETYVRLTDANFTDGSQLVVTGLYQI